MTDLRYPLHAAAREGRHDDLKSLLLCGLHDVNEATFELVRPLHEACFCGQYECAALLIEHGANVNLSNIDGGTALCDACCNGNLKIIELLLNSGANVNPPFLMTTPVHEAVFRDNWKCLELLSKHGALLDKNDCHYGTPLHVAAYKGYIKSAEALLKAGASPNVSKTHQTPLHEAARSQDLPLVHMLLEHGADVYARDSQGCTARQLVPCSTSLCKLYLQEWERTPKTLRFHCRMVIRRAVDVKKLKCPMQLNLPKILVRFLQFE
ncbi:ankyrin repeat and SOCS box protein 13 [Aplysia californica]|uniref:Ankyrin repeat and SOCS box protein 13 n=1 Tax=Aplysia californica TaxID=6500 RepID=A0ABM1VPM4_APLCA|nr:ankyrin repeat and SOCS box protein 13 [Aplysia californica]XP_035824366.1 ankyrin repeat and SOCS box protein 13 [Aplysia californica]XP_035824367.1 ankyrin repeat and SOCS box protein 13 [Aplysia californica]